MTREEFKEAIDLDCTGYKLSLDYIVNKTFEMFDNQLFRNISSAEPYYLKKVHANLPKPKFS